MTEYINCFVQERVDEDWVWIIENRVGLWISQKGNSGYWDCVNIYSQYLGILKKRLIRRDFAGLIVAIRPKGLKEGKTKEQLKNSMDQCPLSLKLDRIGNYPENSEYGKIVKELEDLFNEPVSYDKQEESFDTVESRLKEYLVKSVETDQYAKICKGETYCGYTTTLSIEKYASKKFMKSKMPSSILIYECVEEKVSDDTISMMVGRYGNDRKIKMVIASSSGFDERIKKIAKERDVQLIRVNPKYEITENDILTPRMEFGYSVYNYEHKMLSGTAPMTVPLVIQDGDYTTTSLTAFLRRNGIPVKKPRSVRAPMLPRDFIEEVVSQIIKEDVDICVAMLNRCGIDDKVPYCKIDPYKYARQANLKVCRSDLSEQQHLGHIDMGKNEVCLSDKYEAGDPCDRFSMAHEYGHHILHTHHIFRDFLKRDAELTAEAASDMSEKKWLEVQANVFASYMLMPREVVELLYDIYWRKWFKSDKVKPLYVKAPVYYDKNFQHVVGPVARHMGVSMEAMSITLQEMGLLFDEMEICMEKVV